MNKKNLGAFYTTNTEKVFGGYSNILAKQPSVVDPFVGEGFLLDYAKSLGVPKVLGIDLNPYVAPDIVNNSLLNPLKLDGFVFTNPPYLFRNKSGNKEVFDKWGVDDLYKASLLMLSEFSEEGLVVVPQNLFLDDDWDFRRQLFSVWNISNITWHDQVVFDDTNVRVACFQYRRGETNSLFGEPLVDNKHHKLRLGFDWWEILSIGSRSGVTCTRVTETEGSLSARNIVLYATDKGSKGGELHFQVEEKPYMGKVSDRNKASFSFNSNKTDEELCLILNKTISEIRLKYGSKVLTNFLQSKSSTRKRVSFSQACNLIKYVISL